MLDDKKGFEPSEWEFINPTNLHFSLNNSDGLLWEFLIGTKTQEGNIRGMPIGFLIQDGIEGVKFESNTRDTEYSYRMLMSGRHFLFFRRKKNG